VSGKAPADIAGWYKRKFDISERSIATAGSCFAQHIGRALRRHGFDFADAEQPPCALPANRRSAYGFDLYSARYGNIYTSRQLVQLFDRAAGIFIPCESHWTHHGGFVDPFRPLIEAEPFESCDEMQFSREVHLQRVMKLFERMGVFVFTLGLTECWVSAEDGAVFPLAPGVAGGCFDPARHAFLNLGYGDVVADMEGFIARVRVINPEARFLLTVSPVPLAATATTDNVIVATTYSKSVLRAACGHLASRHNCVDYFPSYEIISSHAMKGIFYGEDGRSVTPEGVEHVMRQFFAEHPAPKNRKPSPLERLSALLDAACEEELIAAARQQS
jgi:hypothetical protein